MPDIHAQMSEVRKFLLKEKPIEYTNAIETARNIWRSQVQSLYGITDEMLKQYTPKQIWKQGKQTHGEDFPWLREIVYRKLIELYNQIQRDMEPIF